jgi:hypothetical protein
VYSNRYADIDALLGEGHPMNSVTWRDQAHRSPGHAAGCRLGWLLLLGPETAALSDVHSQTTSAAEQNDVLRLQLVELQTQEKELEQIRADAAALAVKFPATADQPACSRR